MLTESQFWAAKADMHADADLLLFGMAMVCTVIAGLDMLARRFYVASRSVA